MVPPMLFVGVFRRRRRARGWLSDLRLSDLRLSALRLSDLRLSALRLSALSEGSRVDR